MITKLLFLCLVGILFHPEEAYLPSGIIEYGNGCSKKFYCIGSFIKQELFPFLIFFSILLFAA